MPDKNDILQEALNVLDRDGWCKHEIEDTEGRVCLAGALQKAAAIQFGYMRPDEWLTPRRDEEVHDFHLKAHYGQAWDAVEHLIDEPANEPPHGSIPNFNDDTSTTVEDVKLLLKRAMEDN
jgi:hypothetical protein